MPFFMTPTAASVLLAAGTTFSPARDSTAPFDAWRASRQSPAAVGLFSPRGVVPAAAVRDPLAGWLPGRTAFAARPDTFPIPGFRTSTSIAPGVTRLAEASGRPAVVAPGFRTDPFTGRSEFMPRSEFNNNFGRPMSFNNNFGRPMSFNNNFGRPMMFNNNFGQPMTFNNAFGRPMMFNNAFTPRVMTFGGRRR